MIFESKLNILFAAFCIFLAIVLRNFSFQFTSKFLIYNLARKPSSFLFCSEKSLKWTCQSIETFKYPSFSLIVLRITTKSNILGNCYLKSIKRRKVLFRVFILLRFSLLYYFAFCWYLQIFYRLHIRVVLCQDFSNILIMSLNIDLDLV